jgi:hypothetical protein
LLLIMLAGCGATSTRATLAASTSTNSSTSQAVAPQGPQLGYFWDATQKNLYPVLGIAGAAHYGAPLLPSDSKYVTGAVSGVTESSEWALLLDGAGTLDLVTLPAIAPSLLTTRVPLDAKIVFAPAGGYAVILSPSANTALLVSGLPGQPQVSALATPAGSTLTGAAVSDRGTVLAGWAGGSGVQVGTLSSTGATAMANVAVWGGAGFVPGAAASGQEQAVVADGSSGKLMRLAGIGGAAPTATSLATGSQLQTPVAVAISGDGNWAFAADSAKQQIVRVDLSGSTAPLAIACACQPARLVALPGNLLFQISADQVAQPAWLLDGHAPTPHTLFVPALAVTTAAIPATKLPAGGGL